MQPRSYSANCPHTELISDIVTSSKIKMKFCASGRPMTWLKITRLREGSTELTISTYCTNCLDFFYTHGILILCEIPEICWLFKTRSWFPRSPEFEPFFGFLFHINNIEIDMLARIFNVCKVMGKQQIVLFFVCFFICRKLLQLFLFTIQISYQDHCSLFMWIVLLV